MSEQKVCRQFGPLPKTSTGKIMKFVLREQEWKGREELSPIFFLERAGDVFSERVAADRK